MFRKGEVIMYPNHGEAIIKRVIRENSKNKYYELLYSENLELLVPVDKAEELGMRYPLGKALIIKLHKNLQAINVKDYDFTNTTKIVLEHLATGKLVDLLFVLKLFNKIAKEKELVNKRLELSQRQLLLQARFIYESEIFHVFSRNKAEEFMI